MRSEPMNESRDAFGQALLDRLAGRETHEIIERSDGFIEVSAPTASYFAPYEEWGSLGQRAADAVRGRVLDVGAGAGRFSLHLQKRGHDVVAIDVSPGAVAVCRRRGVRDARVVSISQVSGRLGRFDTILMMGNNFGLFGSADGVKKLLGRFHRITNPGARIIAQILDPSTTEDPAHLAYQESNRRRGRLPGQIRMRVRYRTRRTPWFDYLFVSEAELRDLLRETPWKVSQPIGREGPHYVVGLDRMG